MTIRILSTVMVAFGIAGCQSDWLEVKRDKALIVPKTLEDMQLLLHDEQIVAKDNNNFMELSADDYYIPSSLYASRTIIEKNTYIWAADIYEGQMDIADWDQAYAQVELANVVLDALKEIKVNSGNKEQWEEIRGAALHLRGRAFYYLAQTFAPPYYPSAAARDTGIPIRTSSDINVSTKRASLQETYDRIVSDFEQAAELLPESPEFITDPSKPSAYAFLARCYLVMGNYEKAFEWSEKCLQVRNTLLDYNTLDPTANYPIPRFNSEIIQHTEMSLYYGAFGTTSSRVPDAIRNSYDDNDLRKTIYFRNRDSGELGAYAFKGSYTGQLLLFSGVAVDEMYLIHAECNARLNRVAEAMEDLNTLLKNRWKQGTFVNLTASSQSEAVSVILAERRKELLRRGLRWSDLRRLNADESSTETITRTIDGQVYRLPPGDPRYTLPIPGYVIELSGIGQNPR